MCFDDDILSQREFEADFEMFVDMYEFRHREQKMSGSNADNDDFLERFKESDYESVERLRRM